MRSRLILLGLVLACIAILPRLGAQDAKDKDKKDNDQHPNAKHQDGNKDQSTKNTSSEDKSGAKNAQHDQHGKGK